MKKHKIVISVLLAVLLLISTFGNNVFATQDSTISTIGKNAAFYLTSTSGEVWDDVDVTSIIPLYDFDDKLIAYSVDLQNNKSGEEGYVIVSNIEGDGPIYEFAIGSSSPYGEIKESAENVAIYNGALDYYVKSKVEKESKEVYKYKDLKTGIEIADESIDILKKESKDKVYKSKNEKSANGLRDILISAQKPADLEMTVMAVISEIISGVPDYQWYQGCSPTSAAMVLKYRWSSLPDETTLIDELAANMGTNSSGGTSLGMIPLGISSTMQDHDMIVSSWNDGSGRSRSTLSEYCSQINSDKPVVVTLVNNTQPAPGYPNGYGTHTVAGIGYYKSSIDGNFIIVHDTNTNGEMWLDFDASSFGTNYWTYVD